MTVEVEIGQEVAVGITEVISVLTDNIGGYPGERAYIVRTSNRPKTGYENTRAPVMVISETTPIIPSVGIHILVRIKNSVTPHGTEYDRWIIKNVNGQEKETTNS